MSTSVDGYTVTLAGTLKAGTEGELRLTVSHGGRPVTDLQPYLGAYGHLVALRAGDATTRPGPDITFHAHVPSAGTYRLYLDFQHAGKVHTAEFAMAAESSPVLATPNSGHQH
jgi:hypothetical protein